MEICVGVTAFDDGIFPEDFQNESTCQAQPREPYSILLSKALNPRSSIALGSRATNQFIRNCLFMDAKRHSMG